MQINRETVSTFLVTLTMILNHPAGRIHCLQCGRLLFTVEAVIEAVGFLSGVQCNIGKQKNEGGIRCHYDRFDARSVFAPDGHIWRHSHP